MEAHYLAGEAEADAGAAFFGGVEWDENLFVVLLVDRHAVVADVDYYLDRKSVV